MFPPQAGCALNKQGFTLVELLILAVLFLIATVSFGSVLGAAKTSAMSAEKLTQAVYCIQSETEEIRLLAFDQLSSLNGKSFAQGAGKIYVTSVLADLASIRLELTWDPKKSPLITNTLRSKY